jgi:Tfp pilus assembly protein PilX
VENHIKRRRAKGRQQMSGSRNASEHHRLNLERGVALIAAMLTLVVLSTLAAAIIFVTQTETWSTVNYKAMLQARYAAESGAQNALNWLRYTYTPPASMTAFDLTKYPVQDSGDTGPIVLSAMTGVTANYPAAANSGLSPTVQSAFSSALKDASVPGLGVSASYEVSATLLSMSSGGAVSWLTPGAGGPIQTWQITAQGNVAGVRNAQVQVTMTFERTGTPLFNYGIAATNTGCGSIDLAGGDYVDSYNSANGAYGGANAGSAGNIWSAGNITLGTPGRGGTGAYVHGTISTSATSATTVSTSTCAVTSGVPNPDVTNQSGLAAPAYATGGVSKIATAPTYPLPWGCTTNTTASPCYPVASPSTTAQDVSTSCASVTGCASKGTTTLYDNNTLTTVNVYSLAPGAYGNLDIDNADVVHLTAGTYNVNSLNFAKDGQIVIDSGPVVFNVAGKGFTSTGTVINSGGLSGWNLCANGVTGNVGQYNTGTYGAHSNMASCGNTFSAISGVPANFQIVYAGTAMIAATGAPISSTIYAPNAFVETTGAAVGMYGAVVCNKFLEGSQAPVHFDTAIGGQIMQGGPYYRTSFSWSKF